MSIVDRIKYSATQNGTSIPQIERKLNFGNRTIYRWDKNSPSIDKVIAVANLLNVSLSWLATGTADDKTLNDSLDTQTLHFLDNYKKLSDLDKTKIAYFMEICLIDVPETTITYHTIEEKPSSIDPSEESLMPDGTD